MTASQNMATAKTSAISLANYVRFRDFVGNQTGLHFPDHRRADLERGVLEGLAKSGVPSLDLYYEALTANPSGGFMPDLVTLLTVGETYFNRDSGQFDLLRRQIFPKLIEARVVTDKTLRIWSAGCSTGEEPYSLAILLGELVPYIDVWNVTILATDINRESLKSAEKGRYGKWSFRDMPEEWLDKYFFLADTANFHLSANIKERVSFEYLNLKGAAYPSAITHTTDLDLIVCRNVMIYFDEQTTVSIMAKFYDCLAPGGWLLCGASDPIPPRDLFRARNFSGAFIYQKRLPDFEARGVPRKAIKPKAPPKKTGAVKIARPPAPEPESKTCDFNTLAECEALLEVGQPGLAAEKLAVELARDSNSAVALFLMAKTEVARGDLLSAANYAQKVIQSDKLEIRAYYLLSAIHQGLGEDKKAIDYLKKTLYLDPAFIVAHFTLGCLYKNQGNSALAKKSFENVRRLMLGRLKDEIVPESNGITNAKLLEIVETNLKQE